MATTDTTHRTSPLARMGRGFALAGHAAALAARTCYRPNDTVAVSPRWGRHIMAGAPATVEAVDLDHSHPGGHTAACYQPAHVELSLVWHDAMGRVVLRSRERAITVYPCAQVVAHA